MQQFTVFVAGIFCACLFANAQPGTPVDLPHEENFATLPANWTYISDRDGRIRIRDGKLVLDDTERTSVNALNQAILHVDLQGAVDIVLRFDQDPLGDEYHPLPETFVGSAEGDGLAVSVDGNNWRQVTAYQQGRNTVDLSAFFQEHGITPGANTRLNFLQFDNFPADTDGRSIDNLRITGNRADPGQAQTPSPVSLPYRQDFSSLPTPQQGWRLTSSNEGRIRIIDAALRMDDRSGNSTYSLNRAVLHANLSGSRNPVLRFEARESRDEPHPLPQTFQTANGDGVAISVDGRNWIRVVDLNVIHSNWTEHEVNLAEVAQANGLTLGNRVRIAFMQYDNYSHPSDGWEIDKVEIRDEDAGPSDPVPPRQPPNLPPTVIAAGADLAEADLGYWNLGSADPFGNPNPLNSRRRDTSRKVQGSASLQLRTNSGFETRANFPSTRNANWDLRNARTLRFNLYTIGDDYLDGPEITLVSNNGRYVYRPGPGSENMESSKNFWTTVEIPLGGSAAWPRQVIGNPSMAEIDAIEFMGDSDGFGFTMWIDDLRFNPPVRTVLPHLEAPDLTVANIERTPKYERYELDYVNNKPVLLNPNAKRWPAVNERVTWTAHIANRGRNRSSTFAVNWLVNGVQRQTTRHAALQPGATTTVDLPWNWRNDSHDITAEIVPDFAGERTTLNDALTIDSRAYSFVFVVEQATFDIMNGIPNRLGSTSCEDWLNTQLDDMHRRFANSVYDFAPNGAEARTRIDQIILRANGRGGRLEDIGPTADGGWVFKASHRREYRDYHLIYHEALVHELVHQLGVIDTYAFQVERGRNEVDQKQYFHPELSLMGGSPVRPPGGPAMLSPHSVYGLNSTLGFRRGYYGEYLYDVPPTIRVRVRGANGRALAGARVAFHQSSRPFNEDSLVDNTAEFTLTTDLNGYATLPNRAIQGGGVTTATGHTLAANPFGLHSVVGFDCTFLMEAKYGNNTFVQPFFLSEANVAYARGVRNYTIQLRTDF